MPDDITILCSFMANDSLGSALDRLVHLNNAAPNNADYNAMVKSMSATGWDSGTAQAGGGCGLMVLPCCGNHSCSMLFSTMVTELYSAVLT